MILIRCFYKLTKFVVTILARLIGPIHAPWTRKRTNLKTVNAIQSVARPGDVLLSRTKGELTTLVIPGFWKHAAIYVGNGKVIEAVSPFVKKSELSDFVYKTDYVSLLRVRNIKKTLGNRIAKRARDHIGKKYDFDLDIQNQDKVFCSEVAVDSINYVMGAYLRARTIFGQETITPDDLYNSREQLDLLFENK